MDHNSQRVVSEAVDCACRNGFHGKCVCGNGLYEQGDMVLGLRLMEFGWLCFRLCAKEMDQGTSAAQARWVGMRMFEVRRMGNGDSSLQNKYTSAVSFSFRFSQSSSGLPSSTCSRALGPSRRDRTSSHLPAAARNLGQERAVTGSCDCLTGKEHIYLGQTSNSLSFVTLTERLTQTARRTLLH